MNDDIRTIRARLGRALLLALCPEDLVGLAGDLCDELEAWRRVGVALEVDGPTAALAEVLRLRALLRWREGEVPRG